MTILPAKRSGSSNNNNNTEDAKDTTSQNPPKERPSRHRDELNTQEDSSTSRRKFNYGGSSAERTDHVRFKDSSIDSCWDRRERERQKQKDVRREQRKRDRQINRKPETKEEIEIPSAAVVTSEADAPPPVEKEENPSDEDKCDGFNSEDEYKPGKPIPDGTDEDWNRRDAYFSRCLLTLGFEIKTMQNDGACLFRAIADQVYGDQELHAYVRSQCMDYIVQNRDYFAPYVTEDFNKYIQRKRKTDVHGNHLEIQALSEMYNRTIEVYCYHNEPINIFNASRINAYEPIRVSYHRRCHYNSITNPKSPSILVGLGLPNYFTRCDLDRIEVHDAVRQSEELLIEQTMLEDKMKASDWEATYDAMEEEIARQSYIQYYQDAERRLKVESNSSAGSSSTVTSAACSSPRPSRRGSLSPRGSSSPKGSPSPKASCMSPKPSCMSPKLSCMSPKLVSSPKASCSPKYQINESAPEVPEAAPQQSVEFGPELNQSDCTVTSETLTQKEGPSVEASDENEFQDWEESIMAQILAESQMDYFDDLKRKVLNRHDSPEPSTSH